MFLCWHGNCNAVPAHGNTARGKQQEYMTMASRHSTLTNGAIVAAIAKLNYAATPELVEQLSHTVVAGMRAGEVYLRVILAHMQSKLGRPRRGKQPPQEPVLDAVHEELYPSVLRGVGPAEMPDDERNGLANFARTMASTVRFFIRHGGDVRGLDVATVTKTGLRKMVTPETTADPIVGGSRAERAFLRAVEGVKRQVAAMARGDPLIARERVEAFMDELDDLLAALPTPPAAEATQPPAQDFGSTTTIVAGHGRGRSQPTQPAQLHRGA
jgi:hypothetical protein